MNKLIDLNNIDNQTYKITEDWLEIKDLGSNSYHFGFWCVKLCSSANGQEYLKYEGVSKIGLLSVLEHYGYYKRYRSNNTHIFVHSNKNILKLVTPTQMKDFALDLIKSLPEKVDVLGFKIQSEKLKEIFLREHNVLFGENALSPLQTHKANFLSDDKDTMYFPFKNTVVKVTASGTKLIEYEHLEKLCIWEDHIIKRTFTLASTKTMFEDYISNISNANPKRINAFRVAIGYCLHRHYSPVSTKAILLYDEQQTDANSAHGGTGKGLFVDSLSKLRERETIDGKKFDGNDKFALQRISESTEIVFFDDVRHDFEFERFNSILTNGWEIEAKNQKTFRIALENSPKMVIASNSIIQTKDGNTAERRQFILEFSDFYSKLKNETQKPVIDTHGCIFFDEWDDNEWLAFDNYMIKSCQTYIKDGLPINETINVRFNRLLQATSGDFVDWMVQKDFHTEVLYPFMSNFWDFRGLYYGESSNFSSKSFGSWVKLYAKTNGFEYKTKRISDVTNFYFTLK